MYSLSFVATTASGHQFEVYLNLAKRMNLNGIDQLWIADITYIRLAGEFVFLAVILDAFSRKVVGWELGRTLMARLPAAALERAIATRRPGPGLVHHSDRGVQYASGEYLAILRREQMLPSMSRPGNPYDNARCESFMRTLKREEVHAGRYRDMDDLRAQMEEFLDRYYNRQRLHSALGYRTPEEFEASAQPGAAWPGASLSFSRHGEVYRWDRSEEPVAPGSPTHPEIDEPPVGYSLTGWSPPEPASASPTGLQLEG